MTAIAERIEDPVDRRTAALVALGDRVAPISTADERSLPVPGALAGLLPQGALVRGRTLACTGPAALTLALGLVAPALAEGAWLAVIDVPELGLDAARELGLPLERLVGITAGITAGCAPWVDVVAAAADGFDLLLVRVPAAVRQAAVRTLSARLQQRGVVTLVLGAPGAVPCDGTLSTSAPSWEGIGRGYGHLSRQRLVVTASGRRIPGRRTRRLVIDGSAIHEEPASPIVQPAAFAGSA